MIVALAVEARSLGARGLRAGDCVRWRGGWLAVAGIGPRNAGTSAERLLGCGITRLANWGVAGALDATLAPGDVLVPERVGSEATGALATDPAGAAALVVALAAHVHVRRGSLWTSAVPVATVAAKRALATASGAVAVDMEAAAIAAVAQRARVPFVAVKAICDSASHALPERLVGALADRADAVSWRTLWALAAGGPRAWNATRTLARDFACARRALAAAAVVAA